MCNPVIEINIDYDQAERFTSLLIKFLSQKWKPTTEYFNDFHVLAEGKLLSIYKEEVELHLSIEDVDLLFSNISEELDSFDIDPDLFTINISITTVEIDHKTMGVYYIKCDNGEEQSTNETN